MVQSAGSFQQDSEYSSTLEKRAIRPVCKVHSLEHYKSLSAKLCVVRVLNVFICQCLLSYKEREYKYLTNIV